MKFFCICGDEDVKTGMRLAGIEGEIVKNENELETTLTAAIKNSEIGIVLISHTAANLNLELVNKLKLKQTIPLIIKIPDYNGGFDISSTIAEYIKDSIGIKI